MEPQTEGSPSPEVPFKKPILIGKIGKLPRKMQTVEKIVPESEDTPQVEQIQVEPPPTREIPPVEKLPDNTNPVPYREPHWSGMPDTLGTKYMFEVLKDGSIIDTLDLMSKPFWVFGRLAGCDVCMQHPTISRYHAVLQYRREKTESEPAGFYIYDLGSTHGTFLNKNRLKSKVYARIKVGHMLKLGCSTRTYILTGPDDDREAESPLTVTELKQKRQEDLRKREEIENEIQIKKQKDEEKRKRDEEKGIDWGLGEDADEDADLSENPYAQTNNEELYLDNPKKALRGFFEREGLELEYDCSEQGIGQFLCKVELPIDDDRGRSIFAEVIHKGKKKEAVVQCALEACRILDRHGLLRQATHESRKRKPKNWEENDYYDSDDDTFLDRTGTVEKKREMRMKAKCSPKAETYESLMEKEKEIAKSIGKLEQELLQAQNFLNSQNSENVDEDSLDTYMKELNHNKPDKQTVNRLKAELSKLKQEHGNIIRLVNIARPTSLPPLVPDYVSIPSTSGSLVKNKTLPAFGKRKKIKLQLADKRTPSEHVVGDNVEDAEEEHDDNESGDVNNEPVEENAENTQADGETIMETEDISSSGSSDGEGNPAGLSLNPLRNFRNTVTFRKFEKILEKNLPPFAGRHQDKLTRILNTLKKLASDGDRMDVDWKMLEAKKRKVMKLISDMNSSEPDEKLEFKVSSELNRILNELNVMTEQKFKVITKVKKMGNELKTISEQLDTDLKRLNEEPPLDNNLEASTSQQQINDDNDDDDDDDDDGDMVEEKADERKKQKNQRRIQQRQHKEESKRQREYEEDANREDYNMWVPPSNQSGDGRTSLNDKYGY